MRVLFLTRLYKPHVGGVEKHIAGITDILSKKHEIVIVAEQHDSALPTYEEYSDVKIHRIPIINISEKTKKFVIWKWWLKHFNLVHDADIVHIHDVFFWLLPFKPFFPSKKMFITFHGYEGSDNPGLRQIIWHKLGEWCTLGNICIGDFHKKWYRVNPTLVSYGAVKAPKIYASVKKSKNEIAYLGRLSTDTGIMEFMAAVKNRKVGIDVIGDGPLRKKAENYCNKNKINAYFMGFVPDANERLFGYKVIFTSGYLGILESLINKLPVISCYSMDIKRDYLFQAPFSRYIDICGNSSEISVALDRIIFSPKSIQPRINAGYNWAKAQTWEKLAKNYEDLWNQRIKIESPS